MNKKILKYPKANQTEWKNIIMYLDNTAKNISEALREQDEIKALGYLALTQRRITAFFKNTKG